MRELSPEYLRQFLSYADALSWLEDMQAGSGRGDGEEKRRADAPAKKDRGAPTTAHAEPIHAARGCQPLRLDGGALAMSARPARRA